MTYEVNEANIELNFFDDGPGIPDIELAMKKGYSTASQIAHLNGFGAGMGLNNIKELSDRHAKLQKELSSKMERWVYLNEKAEQIKNS